jgi:hypothetical protein
MCSPLEALVWSSLVEENRAISLFLVFLSSNSAILLMVIERKNVTEYTCLLRLIASIGADPAWILCSMAFFTFLAYRHQVALRT